MIPKLNPHTTQKGKIGREFRFLTSFKGKSEKWVNRQLKNNWKHIFKYTDDGTYFGIHENHEGKMIEKLTHEQCLKLFTL